jgi:hypothetical protein
MNNVTNCTAPANTTASPVNPTGQSKTTSVRIGETVRRLMNALMLSLATPHI